MSSTTLIRNSFNAVSNEWIEIIVLCWYIQCILNTAPHTHTHSPSHTHTHTHVHMEGVWKVMFLCVCICTPRQGIKMKQNTKYSSEHVLCSCASLFHICSLLFNTIPPALNIFFKPIIVELFKLFSKPFSCSFMSFFITCERNSSYLLNATHLI